LEEKTDENFDFYKDEEEKDDGDAEE